jgi:uncharacterized protein YcfJ
MNRFLTGTMWVGLSVLATGGVSACNRNASAEGPQYAKVVSVEPIKQTINHPRQECHDEVVTQHKPVQDEHQIAGTVIGAVVGGALGNQIGGGNGKKLATVAGAVGGGYAGKKIQERHQENATTTNTVQRCTTVNDKSSKVVGYTVKYEVDGTIHSTRMDHDPGDRVEITKGVTAVSDAQ